MDKHNEYTAISVNTDIFKAQWNERFGKITVMGLTT